MATNHNHNHNQHHRPPELLHHIAEMQDPLMAAVVAGVAEAELARTTTATTATRTARRTAPVPLSILGGDPGPGVTPGVTTGPRLRVRFNHTTGGVFAGSQGQQQEQQLVLGATSSSSTVNPRRSAATYNNHNAGHAEDDTDAGSDSDEEDDSSDEEEHDGNDHVLLYGRKMTLASLKERALEHGGYDTPQLNDILYLHFVGYRSISKHLSRNFTGLKALYLESNGLQHISKNSFMPGLTELRCLFLHQNLISTLSGEYLTGLTNLVQLDLSDNRITHVEGLASLQNLATVNLAKNALADGHSIAHLALCAKLTSLDLSGNQLRDRADADANNGGGDINDNANNNEDVSVRTALTNMTSLKSLSMKGNPVLRESSNFRRLLLSHSSFQHTLAYFDKPIFDVERVAASAWAAGGLEAERKAKTEFHAAKQRKHRQSMEVSYQVLYSTIVYINTSYQSERTNERTKGTRQADMILDNTLNCCCVLPYYQLVIIKKRPALLQYISSILCSTLSSLVSLFILLIQLYTYIILTLS
jgi:dynein assembly factor 1